MGMDWSTWVAGALTLLVGQILGMGTEVFRRRLERRRRVEERAELAAQKVLDVLERARKLFDGFTEIGTGPEDKSVYDLCMLSSGKCSYCRIRR